MTAPTGNAEPRGDHRMLFQHMAGKEGDHHRLQAVRHEGDEHRRGIKEEVAEERADTANKEGGERVEQNGRRADDDIVEVQMPAGDGDTEGTESDIQCREHSRHRDTQDGKVRFFRCFDHGIAFLSLFATVLFGKLSLALSGRL